MLVMRLGPSTESLGCVLLECIFAFSRLTVFHSDKPLVRSMGGEGGLFVGVVIFIGTSCSSCVNFAALLL